MEGVKGHRQKRRKEAAAAAAASTAAAANGAGVNAAANPTERASAHPRAAPNFAAARAPGTFSTGAIEHADHIGRGGRGRAPSAQSDSEEHQPPTSPRATSTTK